MNSEASPFLGFRPFQANFLRGHPGILKLDLDDNLKYTLYVIQYETYGRAHRSRSPQNCYGFFPLTGSLLAKRLGIGTENVATKKLLALEAMGYVELRRTAPNAPYDVRLRWQGTSEPHPAFAGFKPGFSAVEIPNDLFTIQDENFGAELRMTLLATHSHLHLQAQELGRDLYSFQQLFLPELRENLQTAERTLRWRIQALVELGYLQMEAIEGTRKGTYRLTWRGLEMEAKETLKTDLTGNKVEGVGNELEGVGKKLDPIGKKLEGVGKKLDPLSDVGEKLDPIGKKLDPSTGKKLDPLRQWEVQETSPLSIKPSLTLPSLGSQAQQTVSEPVSQKLVGGGETPAAEKTSLLQDPVVLFCFETLETQGISFSILKIRQLEERRTREEITPILKAIMAELAQGHPQTAEAVFAKLLGEQGSVQAFTPGKASKMPPRLEQAFAIQNANRKKFSALAEPVHHQGLFAVALAALAERPERRPWDLQGFGFPSERKPLDAPPLRMLISTLQGNLDSAGESLPALVETKVSSAFRTVGSAMGESGSDRKLWHQAVEDLCSAAVFGLNYLLAQKDSEHLLPLKKEILEFLGTWVTPASGAKTDLFKLLSLDVRKGLQEALEACENIA